LAPKIHNLVRLAELGNLPITTEQRTFLGFFNQYQIEGRYPDQLPPSPDRGAAKKHLKQAQEILKWLTHQF
jgi:HEPN domain-containing protein